MLGTVKAKAGNSPAFVNVSWRLPIGGLCDLYEHTGLTPSEIMEELSGDVPQEEDGGEALTEYLDFLKSNQKLEDLVRTILEVAFEWGHNPPGVTFEQQAGVIFDLGKGITLLPLAGKVLEAAATGLKNDPFPESKPSEETGDEGFTVSIFLQSAGALGVDPKTVMEMTLWEFAHYTKGKNGAGSNDALSQSEIDAINKTLDEFETQG